jgi:hypothetical protein
MLATAGEDRSIRPWDVTARKNTATLKASGEGLG